MTLYVLIRKDLHLKRHELIALSIKASFSFVRENNVITPNTNFEFSHDEVKWFTDGLDVDIRWCDSLSVLDEIAFKVQFLKDVFCYSVYDEKIVKDEIVAAVIGPTDSQRVVELLTRMKKV